MRRVQPALVVLGDRDDVVLGQAARVVAAMAPDVDVLAVVDGGGAALGLRLLERLPLFSCDEDERCPLLNELATVIAAKKGFNIIALDVRNVSSMSD